MSVGSWLRARRRAVASTATLSVLGSALVVAAAMSDGVAVPDVELNDGSVWVTNSSQLLVGRLNRQVEELGSGLRAASTDFDVFQDGSSVFVQDGAGGTLQQVDVAFAALGREIALPDDAEVALGGDTVGVLRPDDGAVWVRTVESVATLDVENEDPDVTLGEGGRLVVGKDGTAHGLDVGTGDVVDLTPGRSPRTTSLGSALPDDRDQADLTAVGGRAVVLDRSAGQLLVPGGDTLPVDAGEDAVLQQAGPDSSSVLVGTATGLLEVPLDGGRVTSMDAGAEGTPVPPVRVGSCVHAAWEGSALYGKRCAGAEFSTQPVPEAEGATRLEFRVNRTVVVLNDLQTGNVWLLDDEMTRVSNWDDVTPPDEQQDDEEQDQLQEQVQAVQAERDQENRPPTAVDDELGVRPGRDTLLPVLDNDTDPDGDVLTIADDLPAELPIGVPQLVSDDRGVQVSVPLDTVGQAAFQYEVSDGRGGTARATATVTVRPYDVNAAPVQLRRSTGQVEQGGQVTVRVLPDFRDPDGDDLVLQSAVPTTPDGVQFRPDGTVTFADSGTTPGRKSVTLIVGDGRETVEGELVIDVKPVGPVPPVANADHVLTYVNRTTTVTPLVNDTDANGDDLRLSRVDAPAELQARTDPVAGTFTVVPTRAGPYYVNYVVTDGPSSAVSWVRIDVLDPVAGNRPPVAVRDQALLPDGGQVLVDVVVNDEDPDGDVLVVQQVSGGPENGLSVAVLDHRVLRISATRALTAPAALSYVVSDGLQQATGSVLVVPVPRAAQQQPPVAVPDTATVRAGDVVTIRVLENDSHPDGDRITLQHELAQDVPEGSGLLFVDGDVLRFQAPDQPGTVVALYTIADSQGQTASTQVTIYVRPADADNQPPQPTELVARSYAGATVRITVPLAGIDPDGDSVTLAGIDQAPQKGRVTEVDADSFVYEAFPASAGTDTFSYAVVDRLGARAVASVRVGIAPRLGNQPPVAVDDLAVVRPGRTATVAVLANDSDPDGDVIGFADPALQVPAGVDARTSGGSVRVATGAAGSVTVPYTIQDGRGGKSTAYVTVEARDDAPLLAPIARDDAVTAEQAEGQTSVDVPVLANDVDPDGPASELRVDVAGRSDTARVDGNRIRVQMTSSPQVIAYSVTDGDDLRSLAFVRVPASDDGAPALKAGASVEVAQGSSVDIDLADVVVVRSGREPRVTVEARVTATNSDGTPLVVDAGTLRFAPARDYAGPASISFEVTDGSGPDDPQGKTAVLTLPVTVTSSSNRPPVWNGAELQVSAGEPASELDLRTAVTDPDPGDASRLEFRRNGDLPAGFTVALDGPRLAISARDVPTGTLATLPLTVSDGTNPPVPAAVTVRVAASTRPLAKAVDDVVPDADQGRTVTVDVLANDSNPFPDTPLRLLTAVSETGGAGTPSVDGNRLSITPPGDFVGTLVVRYTVEDATADVARHVDGRVYVTVRGRPGAPTAPTVLEVRDRTVVLTWTAPVANGAPVTSYRVQAAGVDRECPSTTCTIDGLTNDVEYRFTVTARNVVGESDPSPASAPARPDVRPDRPAPPELVFGDRSLQVSWTPPNSPGSAIDSYDLEISPAGAGGTQVTVSGTSYTWTGLTNGQSYQLRIRAHNRAPEPSDWSDYSRAETPAGVPVAPAAPTATPSGGAVGQQIDVSWQQPADNGAPITGYELQVFRGVTLSQTVPVSGTTQTVAAQNSNDYSFKVVAINRAGRSDASPASATVRPFGAPSQVPSVQASEEDGRSTLSFSDADPNGKPIVRYEYRVNGGAEQTLAASRVVGGLSNGSTYRFEVRACNDYCGNWSPQSNAAVPYGPVGQPGLTGSGGATSVTFSWSPPSPNGRPIDHLEYTINGAGLTRVAPTNGSVTVGNGYNQNYVMQLWAFDSAGQRSVDNTQGASTGNPPPPPARNYAVDDAFLGGTCALGSPQGGAWKNQSQCSGGQWFPNGSVVGVVCATTGPNYDVRYADGSIRTWNWYARLNNGLYARAAPLWANNNSDGNPTC